MNDASAAADEQKRLAGTVHQEVFRGPTGFAVLKVRAPGRGLVTVCGQLPPAHPGERLDAHGGWEADPRFGLQFRATHATVSAPAGSDAILRFLCSGTVEGIGPALAKRIVERFGDETVQVLDQEPARLREVKGIGKKKLAAILGSWEAQRESREALLALRGHGLGPVLAERVLTKYGAGTRAVLDQDPFRLAREVEGVGFLTADRLAGALGMAIDDPRRLRAALFHALETARDDGHVALGVEELLERGRQVLGGRGGAEALEQALLHARQAGELELDRPDGQDRVYLPVVLHAERGAARAVLELLGARRRLLPPIQVDKALAWVSGRSGIELTADQALAIRAALESPLTVITGGPGVGKTTIVRALVEVLRAKQARFALAAPTGRAAKRLEEATGAPAATLHRLLEWDPRAAGFTRHAEDPLEVDLLAVDEASMVDLRLFHALVRALPPGASLVLIGDVDQLPSVGAGAVLKDLIASGVARVVRLTEVFRQAARSRIVAAAHAVNQGVVPDLGLPAEGQESDLYFVEREDPQAARDTIVELVHTRIPRKWGLDPLLGVQVLAPMRKGACGTEGLNRALRAALCPDAAAGAPPPRRRPLDGDQEPGDEPPLRAGPGDKVMQLKNDYEREVWNGDVGRVLRREPGNLLIVDFDGREVPYTPGQAGQLALAYCATIHKSQGSEYPAVVIPVLTEHWVMLERNLLYTGLTRARQVAVLVGQRRAIEAAVQNDRPRQRLSFLAHRLRRAAEGE